MLLAVNHIGYVDFIYGGLAAASRRAAWSGSWPSASCSTTASSGPLMRSLHHIEVDRGDGRGVVRRGRGVPARAARLVGIFPEATISRAMELKEFKTGAVRIAAAAGVPLVPVVLWGTQRMMTKDHPKDFSRGKTISIRSASRCTPPARTRSPRPPSCTAAMSALLDEAIAAYPADEQPPGAWWLPASYGGTRADARGGRASSTPTRSARAARRSAERSRQDERRRCTVAAITRESLVVCRHVALST